MNQYSVLVVDDSAFMRKSISAIIEANPNFNVIGKARNGLDAIEKVKRLKPNIITLDIEMPELDGIEALKVIMEETPTPVIMLSNEANSTLQAFEYGAVDFVLKNNLVKDKDMVQINDFYNRLNSAAVAKLPKINVIKSNKVEQVKAVPSLNLQSKKDLLIIGSSTGGPAALHTILAQIPSNFSIPIVVVQHMPVGFTKPLADRFNAICHVPVKEAEHGEVLRPGNIYIAPAGIQTTLRKIENGQFIFKQQIVANIDTLYKPSIDVTVLSATAHVKEKLAVVILTGMGDDGLRGCRSVKENGGLVIAESEETCVVYGMPKVVIEAGLADEQYPLPKIFEAIMAAILMK